MNTVSVLLSIILLFAAEFRSVHGAAGEENREELNSALSLERPYIRASLSTYVETSESPRLILGEGHIVDSERLAAEFRKGGDQELTESLVDFVKPYSFHENKGFYTASAELGAGFNSDWCGNFRNPLHRRSLFIPNTFDLIFEATYHPAALSPQLLSDISSSLRSGGVLIMTLPLLEEDGFFMCGHEGFSEHEMPWYSRKVQFGSLEDVYYYWKYFLIAHGFSSVTFHKSPATCWFENLFQEGVISTSDGRKLDEKEITVLLSRFEKDMPLLSQSSPVAQIDPHLAHYALGSHYLIAKKMLMLS